MASYSHPFKLEITTLLANFNESKIGGSATDITHQHEIALAHLFAPVVAGVLKPGVKGRLRLLKKGDFGETRGAGSLSGEIASHGVERSGYRENYLGLIERFFGVLLEHYAGAFPTWLAPVQVRVLPVAEARAMILAHPADRILFGTDSPWSDQAAELARWRALGLPEDFLAAALGGNAARLLG